MKNNHPPRKSPNVSPPEDISAVSSTECTGLMPTPAADESEWDSYRDLYQMETIKEDEKK